ncbi:hypothetical protein [Mesorhizobium humile]|uniref:hypothetical protein n=1 Tax=Mesorhizobium humile TaxID=3072313 RepID=UPI002A23C6E1|nr:hypothetical protein [Mesorhizobium sp. VK2D]
MTTIATFNVHGVTPALLKWLGETRYEIVGLQELTSSDEKFPADAIGQAGHGAIWHGQESCPRRGNSRPGGAQPVERRQGLPGDPVDTLTRPLLEPRSASLIGCLHWLGGNPAAGPKFDYKLACFRRLISYETVLKEDTVLCLGRARRHLCRGASMLDRRCRLLLPDPSGYDLARDGWAIVYVCLLQSYISQRLEPRTMHGVPFRSWRRNQ